MVVDNHQALSTCRGGEVRADGAGMDGGGVGEGES